VEDDVVGKDVELVVSIRQLRNTGHAATREQSVHTVADPVSKWAYEFCGSVTAIDPKNEWFRQDPERLLVLDVGVGTVLVQAKEPSWRHVVDGELGMGDDICVTAARANVIDVLPGE